MAAITTITPLPITEPVVLADPYKGSHVLRWNKSRGQSDAARLGLGSSREASFSVSAEDDDVTTIPYRLPRISPQEDDSPRLERELMLGTSDPDVGPDKVWSRYGYERVISHEKKVLIEIFTSVVPDHLEHSCSLIDITGIRVPELGPQIKMLMPPPRNFLQQYRRTTTPRFQNAAVAPSIHSLPWHLGRGIEDPHSYRGNHTARQPGESMQTPRLEPTPTPVSRSASPAKSVRSIHWVLGHNRYHSFDRQGRCHVQGPYSREFNVTCMAPSNWLKMKWGRSKTMVK